tara:strand:- start:624 stop:1178 length:555 start_codon:yes stop_codon:yes gene_type:complete
MSVESAMKIIGFNLRRDRQKDDYYATPPEAVDALLSVEGFWGNIFEPCCGEGHISKRLIEHGYSVESSDLVDRGYGTSKRDFLFELEKRDNIITNPPYAKMALLMAEHSQKIARYKTAFLLKITFLEGVARAKFFKNHPPKRIWVFSKRMSLLKDGQSYKGGMMCLAWFVWETGSSTRPKIGWI